MADYLEQYLDSDGFCGRKSSQALNANFRPLAAVPSGTAFTSHSCHAYLYQRPNIANLKNSTLQLWTFYSTLPLFFLESAVISFTFRKDITRHHI